MNHQRGQRAGAVWALSPFMWEIATLALPNQEYYGIRCLAVLMLFQKTLVCRLDLPAEQARECQSSIEMIFRGGSGVPSKG